MEIGKPEKYESSLHGNLCISIPSSCSIKDDRISYARSGMFDGASPNLATLLLPTVKEMNLWGLAGTKGISVFVALQGGNG